MAGPENRLEAMRTKKVCREFRGGSDTLIGHFSGSSPPISNGKMSNMLATAAQRYSHLKKTRITRTVELPVLKVRRFYSSPNPVHLFCPLTNKALKSLPLPNHGAGSRSGGGIFGSGQRSVPLIYCIAPPPPHGRLGFYGGVPKSFPSSNHIFA